MQRDANAVSRYLCGLYKQYCCLPLGSKGILYVSPRTTKFKVEQRGKGGKKREMQSAKRQVRDNYTFKNKAEDTNTEHNGLSRQKLRLSRQQVIKY